MPVWDPPRAFDGFELKRPLGQGGMGRVFLAHEVSLDRDVALKFIAGDDPGPEARARFKQEARAIARLQHPSVVAIYRIGEVDGRPYIAYEYVLGKSLDRMAKPVAWTMALRVGLAVARGLALAHSRGVLHRDIKPGNIILAKDGSIKLVDFGLAKVLVEALPEHHLSPEELAQALEEQSATALEAADTALPSGLLTSLRSGATLRNAGTLTGSLVGTPNYLAPEVWLGERASSKSDVYALGLVLHELCSGRCPFEGLAGRALIDRVLKAPLPPLASVCGDLPLSFAAIVDRAASHEPDRRFRDGTEMLAALETVESVLSSFQMLYQQRGKLDDVALVAASLSRVQGKADAVFGSFYERLFHRSPELAQLFPASLVEQKMMLAAALRLAVDNLRNPEKLTPGLEDLGCRHAGYGVVAEHLPLFGDALVATLASFDREWDEATKQAWERAFAAIAEAMKRGMALGALKKGA